MDKINPIKPPTGMFDPIKLCTLTKGKRMGSTIVNIGVWLMSVVRILSTVASWAKYC
jgi:hypothetical protein